MNDTVIRASEIGAYLFCQRAWWYQRRGAESANVRELSRGSAAHHMHARRLRMAGALRFLALLMLAAAAVLWLAR